MEMKRLIMAVTVGVMALPLTAVAQAQSNGENFTGDLADGRQWHPDDGRHQ
jgi:hypothetical protein